MDRKARWRRHRRSPPGKVRILVCEWRRRPHLPARRNGGKPQEGDGVWSPQDADAVPRYRDNARPAYPPLARLRGYQGVVVLLVEVRFDGRVGQASIRRSAGHEILDRAALEAVRTWRFEPGRREGRAVTMSVEVPVRFVLNENSAW